MYFALSVMGWFVVILAILVGICLLIALIAWRMGGLRVVVVQEAKAVAFEYLGRFAYCAMEFTGHCFDPNGNIVAGRGPNGYGGCWCIWRFGGWVFYVHPFVKPAKYGDHNDADKFGDDIFVELGNITAQPFAPRAETSKESGSIALDVDFVTTMRVKNPYRWLYVAPKNARMQVIMRIDAALRGWIRSGDDEHVQSVRGDGSRLWEELLDLGCEPIFDQIEQEWGLDILENSIIVRDVGYDPDYQAALKSRNQSGLEAAASVEQTAGRILLSVATMCGMTPEDLKADLKLHPEKRGLARAQGGYKEDFAYAEDQTKRDRGGVDDIRLGSSDGTSLSGNLGPMGALAALFGGRGNQSNRRNNRNNPGNRDSRGNPKDGNESKTEEEKNAEYERTMHGG